MIAFECKFYLGDRPCIWHKKEGVHCKCEHFQKLQENILIIKLDAMGDVLRTTCLLPVISRKWPHAGISWITGRESTRLLKGNPYIYEILEYGTTSMNHLLSRTFDYVINLDSGKISSALASISKSNNKVGFLLHDKGYVYGTNTEAENWLKMGIFDDLKKDNRKTYQEIMCSILGLSIDGIEYVLQLSDEELERGRHHLQDLGLDLNKPIIGIHTGGGGRWKLKQWNEESYISVIEKLGNIFKNNASIVLFGGHLEKELNNRIIRSVKSLSYDAGCDNEVRHFASLVNNCSVILTGDSLAMHIALAAKRRVVVLFGPTSHAEIELFGLGEKIIPKLDCLVCYKTDCGYIPNCMDSITVDEVSGAILRQFEFIS
ncbi:MAG: hypothetical protein GTO02_05200 [Candidatus Dadabacteria bacterium]|nr:hypothetical protein [Candidatus Dadabacteria bacterium]